MTFPGGKVTGSGRGTLPDFFIPAVFAGGPGSIARGFVENPHVLHVVVVVFGVKPTTTHFGFVDTHEYLEGTTSRTAGGVREELSVDTVHQPRLARGDGFHVVEVFREMFGDEYFYRFPFSGWL